MHKPEDFQFWSDWRFAFRSRGFAQGPLIIWQVLDYAGPDAAAHKLVESEAAIATLEMTPQKGSLHEVIAPGLRAVQAGRKAVIGFVVDDDAAEVLGYEVTYDGED